MDFKITNKQQPVWALRKEPDQMLTHLAISEMNMKPLRTGGPTEEMLGLYPPYHAADSLLSALNKPPELGGPLERSELSHTN